QIDAGPVNEVDTRLTSQLAETDIKVGDLEARKSNKTEVTATNKRIDELVIPISGENANVEVTDAHVSVVKNKTFTTIRNRFEDTEKDVYFPIVNMLENSGFAEGKDNWSAIDADFSVNKGIATMRANAERGLIRITNVPRSLGHKYLIYGRFKSSSHLVGLQLSGVVLPGTYHSGSGEFEVKSAIYTGHLSTVVHVGVLDSRKLDWDDVEVDYIVMIN